MVHTLTSDIAKDISYHELFCHSPLAMYTCDEYGYLNSYNAAAGKLWARIPEIGKARWCGSWQLLQKDGALMPCEQWPMAVALYEKKAIEGMEVIIRRPDDSWKNVLVYCQPMFTPDYKVVGGSCTIIDVTENKTAKERQAMLSAIVASSDDAIIGKNLNGFITSWNRGAQKIFGYLEEEVLGRHISILIPEELRMEEEIIIGRIRAGKKIDHFQTERITKFGKRVNISLTVSPIKNDSGEITGASKIARDITEQLQKQKALEQYSQRLEILNLVGIRMSAKLEESSIIELVTDATTEISNAAFGAFVFLEKTENNSQYKLQNLSGPDKSLFEGSELHQNMVLLNQVFSKKSVLRMADINATSQYKQDAKHHIRSYMAVPIVNSGGDLFGVLFFGHPLPGAFTEEHEEVVKSIASQASIALENSMLFKQVKQLSEKKDEFIALASHELKTPLTTVNGYLQVLQSRSAEGTTQLFIERSLGQIKKLNSLVSDLFDISKVESGKLQLNYEAFDLYLLLKEIAETYQHSCTTHIVSLEFNGTDCVVEADRQRIEQVIINLITNAIKYSPNTNKVLIQLTQSNAAATVMVKDEGIGLTEDEQQKIFTRFYRAEGTSNISGLGLGLYLSNEIIARHHGEIYVKSKPAQGAEFYFSIPVKKPSESINGN